MLQTPLTSIPRARSLAADTETVSKLIDLLGTDKATKARKAELLGAVDELKATADALQVEVKAAQSVIEQSEKAAAQLALEKKSHADAVATSNAWVDERRAVLAKRTQELADLAEQLAGKQKAQDAREQDILLREKAQSEEAERLAQLARDLTSQREKLMAAQVAVSSALQN